MKNAFLILSLLTLWTFGCGRREGLRLDELEEETAGSFLTPLALHEGLSPREPVTNVAQLFAFRDLDRPHRLHPHRLQERFRAFGEQTGFKNSIYEKYIFVPQSMTNFAKGEPVLMSAEPFIDRHGQPMRMVIWKAGKQDYRLDRMEDRRVQGIFREAGVAIPKPTPMPPPPALPPLDPDPFTVKVEKYFRDVAGNLGIGRGSWWIILLLYAGVAGLILLFLFIWVGRRGRH